MTPSVALDDFKRLWATKFLDDLWIEVRDEPYANGVMGKHLIFNLEERQRVRIVDYEGSKALERGKIEDALKEADIQIRPDSFLDLGVVHRVEGVLRGLLQDKGFLNGTATHDVKVVTEGTKLVRLVFNIAEGPKVRIRNVTFTGNQGVGSRSLATSAQAQPCETVVAPAVCDQPRARTSRTKFEEDADRLVEHYRNRGFVSAQVGCAGARATRRLEGRPNTGGWTCGFRSRRDRGTVSASSCSTGRRSSRRKPR